MNFITIEKLQRLVVGAFFMLFTFACFAQAEIKFDDKIQKFKKTKPGPVLEFNYVLTNTGNQPLIINKIEVSCTCTKFEFSGEPIALREKATIYVTFDTNHKFGYQDRILLVYSNAKNSPHKTRFKGMVDVK